MNPGHLRPNLPRTHYIDNRIFTDEAVFRDEQREIFGKVWLFVCHESEVPNPGDYRCARIAQSSLIVVRGEDGVVRAFHNICRHRAAEVVREESGSARSFTCFYHQWEYALDGSLTAVAKPSGYDAVRLDKSALGLVPVRIESFAGLLFACLDPNAPPLLEFLGDVITPVAKPLGTVPLEVFHFHKAVVRTNWKLFSDNNTERYHSMLHSANRASMPWVLGKTSPMKLRVFPNGHGGYWSDGAATVAYDRAGLAAAGGEPLPGMRENEMRVINFFPDLMINIRSNVVRLDRMIPLDPGHTLIEWRGLGVKGDSAEAAALRLRHHNTLWGPTGRNLPEDILAVESQYRAMSGDVVRFSIVAREEDFNPTDDISVRAYYAEWGRRVGREPCAPFGEGH